MQAESQQKAEVTPEDSDLDRKRRETEALLQSIGISPEPPLGTWYSYALNNKSILLLWLWCKRFNKQQHLSCFQTWTEVWTVMSRSAFMKLSEN